MSLANLLNIGNDFQTLWCLKPYAKEKKMTASFYEVFDESDYFKKIQIFSCNI